jgi:hypothetical protein
MLARGPAPLPQEFSQLTGSVPNLRSQAAGLEATGSTLTGQGQSVLSMAGQGQLTAPQQAQLDQYNQGLKNQAAQTFASMGRNINEDTTGISVQADIDSKVNAMAQQDIQSSIQLGLGELSSGSSFTSAGLGFENAANNALIEAGKEQIASDKSYSDSLTAAFTGIASLFGTVAKAGLFA